jgi:PAS domain-containing protein
LDLNYLERWDVPNLAPSDKAPALAEDIQDILDGKATEFHNEYWCPTLTGSRWFVVHATRLELPDSSEAFRVLVNSEDTTRTRRAEEALRDLGGRLITAQEEERSRVARELHKEFLGVKRAFASPSTMCGQQLRRFPLRSTACLINFILPS